MENEFVSYTQAVALKELGFKEDCFGYYGYSKKLHINSNYKDAYNLKELVVAPLYQQAFRWFREKCNLCGVITPQSYEIWGYPDGGCIIEQYPVHTYEEAESACLDKLIEICKNK
jgi:hypothetical protein